MTAAKPFFTLFLIFIIGTAWVFAQFYWLGVSINWFPILFAFPYGMTPVTMHILSVLSNLLVELLPSLVAAWLLSLIRPRRWLIYSAVFIVPEIISTIQLFVTYGPSPYLHYSVARISWFGLTELLRLIQVPILLLLIYKLNNWRSRPEREIGQFRQPSA